jgi:RecB family exonuclease
MIWGTLEARVQGADVVILGGLNEGSWPEAPSPDPWLNREMRAKSGLLLPERRIGLAAHDFQQAIGAPTVILSRAIRDAEAQTVPSRWINRLVNLMSGLTTNGGPDGLAAMRARGQALLDMVDLFDAPIAPPTPAPRPEPAPPVAYRPDRLSVTRVQTLIRDPYAIYASYVLNLRRLNPLRPEPDAALRGTVLHKVLEDFVRDADPNDPDARADLMAKTDTILAEMAPWPADRRAWRAAMERAADWFIEGEAERRKTAVPERLEVRAQTVMENGFTLTAEADRIDRNTDGTVTIYDYKTGSVPTKAAMDAFDKQLYLEAILAERGAFQDMNPTVVHSVAHIGMGSDRKVSSHMMNDTILAETWSGLAELVDRYRDPTLGYKARRALTKTSDRSDYDHLSRFGEWNESTPPTLIKVGRHDPE